MSSTSSSTPLDLQLKTWDAFISFRGKDIRYDFLSHLTKALEQKQINAFIDYRLRKREEISQALWKIIEDSYVSVVILSENYADSPWCLDELVKIVECREKSGQVVLPVFYKVDPTDVQELIGSFGKAFHKLKVECQDCLHKVDGWSKALEEISNLSGWDSRNFKHESELVEEIVKCVLEKLSKMASNDSYDDKSIGIDVHCKKVESLLQIGLENDNRTIGIWGMGGIGKTTIVKAIFSRNMTHFDSSYFVDNVREHTNNQELIMLREKIISQLLEEKDLHINTPHLPRIIRTRLQRMKVMIVFDDVHDSHHLKLLAGECDLFDKGSRIIVTSRDKQVLKNVCPTEYIYEVEGLSGQEALQLFCLHAFKQEHPREGYLDLSEKLIRYAQGNPLALRVLGSNLYDRGMEEWKTKLKKLKNIPDMEILEVLKMSYDGLDHSEKSIFLDIACFLKGRHKHEIERVLEGCGFFTKFGMSQLVDKALITISSNGLVDMPGLLQQMGKHIVYEECKQPEGRSRLWNSEDISHVLTKDTETEKMEGISLNLSEIGLTTVSSRVFEKMCNLRFLKFYDGWGKEKLFFPKRSLEFLSEELRYLQWDDYPMEYLPLKFCPNNLVELHMRESQLQQLWNGNDKPLANLKVMDLSNSLHLIRIPDLSGALNLEILELRGCQSLVEIPSSIQYLSKLTDLDLECCTSLCSLPSCLGLKSLELLNLRSCSKLRECPGIACNVKKLTLDETAIEELPSSIRHCSQLIELSLRSCKMLVSLPQSINQLTKLEELSCQGCDNLTTLPPLTGLSCLWMLDLSRCRSLGDLPELPCIKWLIASECRSLKSASTPFISSLECQSGDGADDALLDFGNCINLESKIIMDHVLESYMEKQVRVELLVPGVEAPERMRYQNKNGSSLSNIKLDDRRITGFSFCVVIDHYYLFDGVDIICMANFKDESGYSLNSNFSFKHYWTFEEKDVQYQHVIEKDLEYQHVILWCKNLDSKGHFTEASFQFYSCNKFYQDVQDIITELDDNMAILKCGVHPIYEDDDCVGRGVKHQPEETTSKEMKQHHPGEGMPGVFEESHRSVLKQFPIPSETPIEETVPLERSNKGLTELPKDVEWEKYTHINLMNNELSKLPESLKCPKLLALFLQENLKLRMIPDSFFDDMLALQVLNLSRTRIKSLPNSLFRLVKLKKLFLKHCELLWRLQSEVGELKCLEVLNLEGTRIMALPKKVERLTNLTSLKVSFCEPMSSRKSEQAEALISDGVILALSQLKKLNIDVSPEDDRWNKSVENVVFEVCKLTRLDALNFYFPRVELLKQKNMRLLSRFTFVVGNHTNRIISRLPHDAELRLKQYDKCLKYINGEGAPEEIKTVLKYASAFHLDRHITISKLSEFGITNMIQLKCCIVGECNKLEAIIDEDQTEVGLVSLEYLYIYYAKSLSSILKGSVIDNFTALKYLTFQMCPELTIIFTPELLANLSHLKELIVDDCPKVTKLVWCNDSEDTTKHVLPPLPSLKKIALHFLPELGSISDILLISPGIEWMSFYYCPKLKSLPISKPLHKNLWKIEGEESWWEELKWESNEQDSWVNIFTPVDECE